MIDAQGYRAARRAANAGYARAVCKAKRRYHWTATTLYATLERRQAQAEPESEAYYDAARDYQAAIEAAGRKRDTALLDALMLDIGAALAAEKKFLDAPCG